MTQVLASYVFTKVEAGEVSMAVTASAFCILLSLLLVLVLRMRGWFVFSQCTICIKRLATTMS